MDEASGPSRTAMTAAAGRAAHLLANGPRALLHDWLAAPFLGAELDGLLELGAALLGEDAQPYATWLAARSRLSEDWLAASGCDHHVVLGAGLDSSAWRSTLAARVFEVDHPATQAWKRARAATLQLPDGPVWVPLDFEHEALGAALASAGAAPGAARFVSWHGVLPYLTASAVTATLQELGPCTIAVTYAPPPDTWEEAARPSGHAAMGAVSSMGEPWISFTTPGEFASMVAAAGFDVAEDVGAEDVERRYGLRAVNFERIALLRPSATP